MNRTGFSVEEMRAMLRHVAVKMVAARDELTQADKAVGDGDHGVGMARGFEAVGVMLEGRTFASIDELLKSVGNTLLAEVGGAAGAVFGTLFRGGAKQLVGQSQWDGTTLVKFLADGLLAVQERGKAKPGDKTMIDALAPAASEGAKLVADPAAPQLPLGEWHSAVAKAAREGMEQTKSMVARIGKAKTLGERSLGHADPGALSLFLILEAMAEFVNQVG